MALNFLRQIQELDYILQKKIPDLFFYTKINLLSVCKIKRLQDMKISQNLTPTLYYLEALIPWMRDQTRKEESYMQETQPRKELRASPDGWL